ncbi:MAG: arylsulfatase A-like enzyme [Planctomycetota bacterium]|jgi:arylsulfatase A-like enzyme
MRSTLAAGVLLWEGPRAPYALEMKCLALELSCSVLLLLPACVSSKEDQGIAAQATRPNIIVIITDDQGYGDLGAHGNEMIQTPHMDRLHQDSVRLTDFHVDPTCSPTRSALMTGRYSTRTGVWHTIMGRSLMDGAEQTMAEVFQAGGYRTGMFGKWHLGDNYPLRPQDQGFEHVVWHHGGGVGQGPDYWDNDYFDDTYEVNGEWREFEGYCTDVWFREATQFIEAESDEPFFAYLSTNAPHGPFLVDESYSEPYVQAGVPATMAKFYGMITNIDENIGRLRTRLEELGIADNTLLLFMTDNGTAVGRAPRAKEEGSWPGFNAGMRGNKGSEYEGGHRVPCFLRWPDGGLEGGRDLDELTAHVDCLPTLADLCGIDYASERELDGISLAPRLLGESQEALERTLFVHSQRIEHPKMWRKNAVMRKDWRLVNGTELYQLRSDAAQATDVAAQHPELVAELRQEYEQWWESLSPAFDDYVRIGIGAAEDPVNLMSHDWHTSDQGVPWHQNHVRNGYVGNGPWSIDVTRSGEYEIVLRRWPAHLKREMRMVQAQVSIAGESAQQELEPSVTSASFRLRLEAGPSELLTTLTRESGESHGAYFASVRWVGP